MQFFCTAFRVEMLSLIRSNIVHNASLEPNKLAAFISLRMRAKLRKKPLVEHASHMRAGQTSNTLTINFISGIIQLLGSILKNFLFSLKEYLSLTATDTAIVVSQNTHDLEEHLTQLWLKVAVSVIVSQVCFIARYQKLIALNLLEQKNKDSDLMGFVRTLIVQNKCDSSHW